MDGSLRAKLGVVKSDNKNAAKNRDEHIDGEDVQGEVTDAGKSDEISKNIEERRAGKKENNKDLTNRYGQMLGVRTEKFR